MPFTLKKLLMLEAEGSSVLAENHIYSRVEAPPPPRVRRSFVHQTVKNKLDSKYSGNTESLNKTPKTLHNSKDNILVTIKREKQNINKTVSNKDCPKDSKMSSRFVSIKKNIPRWRKRDFATRLKRIQRPVLRKPRATYEVLPKFQEDNHNNQCGVFGSEDGVVLAEEVRSLVSKLVLQERGLVYAVLNGYNSFLEQLMTRNTIFLHEYENEYGKHVLKLDEIRTDDVRHTPLVCRQEERSYVLPLTVQASYTCLDGRGSLVRKFSHRLFLGEIPLMVGSKACPIATMTDEEQVAAGHQSGEPGGYFIMDGVEKFIPFRNVHKKNNPLVLRCSGVEGKRFLFKCYVFSFISGTDSYHTAVMMSRKNTLEIKLPLGRGTYMVAPLSNVLALLGLQGELNVQEKSESFLFLKESLATILSLKEQHYNKTKTVLTFGDFRSQDGGKSKVAEAILKYFVAASRLTGVSEHILQKVHKKCEKSEKHHAVLLKIASEYAHKHKKERQQLESVSQLTALRDVMMQGCEDVPLVAQMATAALTLPTEEAARKAILQASKGKWNVSCLREVLERILVPHAGAGLPQRAFYLAFMTNQLLLTVCGRRAVDDPLHLGNRTLVTPGAFFSNLFDSVMKSILQRTRETIEQNYVKARPVWPEELNYVDPYGDQKRSHKAHTLSQHEKNMSEKFDLLNIFQFHHNVLGEIMCRVLKTGTWGRGASTLKGMTQNLHRLNYMQYLSQVRTVNGEDKVINGKGSEPHELHTSIVGFLCPIETPESEHVGLTEHLAIGATVCSKLNIVQDDLFHKLPVKIFGKNECPGVDRLGKVFVDGRWVGNAEAPLWKVKEMLIQYRCQHTLHLGVYIKNHDLYIDLSGGRPVRPLLMVRNGASTITSNDLVALRAGHYSLHKLWRRGILDFLDALENNAAFIAETPADLRKEGVDHCELLSVLSHGILSAAIPVGSTNPGVRRLGSCKMQKQAMGSPVVSKMLSHRGMYSVLKTPEMPHALPRFISEMPNARLMYSGQTALTAVLAVRGLNQEDGLVFSQGAIDRGLFTSQHFHSYRKYEPLLGALVSDCVKVGQRVKAGDVLIKCMNGSENVRVDETNEPSDVVRCSVRSLADGRVVHEVVTMEERKPEVGDKFATLNGQKGVICGILPDDELPRLADGRTPEIFISPHSFLDRQTVGFFVEGILNTLSLHLGTRTDATSIDSGWDLSTALNALNAVGLSSSLPIYSVRGRLLGRAFCAPIFFMRLKHLAVLKCHARYDGPLDPLFRQPQEGLAQGGGLRLGEMEVSALVSHGAAELVKMFLHDQSDGMMLPYCNTCHSWAQMIGNYVSCLKCQKIENIVLRKTSCAFKYLEESLALQNLKLVQFGEGQYPNCLSVQYEDSDLTSLSSSDVDEWEPDNSAKVNAMENIIKATWRDSLKLGGINTMH